MYSERCIFASSALSTIHLPSLPDHTSPRTMLSRNARTAHPSTTRHTRHLRRRTPRRRSLGIVRDHACGQTTAHPVHRVHVRDGLLHVRARLHDDAGASARQLRTAVCGTIACLQLRLLLHQSLTHQRRVLLLLRRGAVAVQISSLRIVVVQLWICAGLLVLLKGCLVLIVTGCGTGHYTMTTRRSVDSILTSLSSLDLPLHMLVRH